MWNQMDRGLSIFGYSSGLMLAMLSQQSFGQWIDFVDETASRISLSSVPSSDAEEKDIALGDLDNDGDEDILVVRKLPFSEVGARDDVLLMNENGVLVDRTVLYGFNSGASDARDVITVDVNNDGWLDVVICTTFEDPLRIYMNLGDDVGGNWLGLSDQSAARLGTVFEAERKYCAVGAGDVNGDNMPDLFFSNYNGGDDLLYINDGFGNFTDETQARMGEYANSAFGTSNMIVDIDGDGDQDILKLTTLFDEDPFERGVYVLWNNGSGIFDALPFQRIVADEPYMFMLEDFNGDGMLDMYVVNDMDDQLYITTGVVADTSWGLTVSYPGPSPRTGGFGGNLRTADLDNDGDMDIGVGPIDTDIANCGSSSGFTILENTGGTLVDPVSIGSPENYQIEPHDFAYIDLNGDGCLDIFMGLCSGYRVFIQDNCVAVCAPDLTGEGDLDFFDVSAFLTAFGNADASADFTDDGSFDFFDVSAFLSAFAAGCP